jgi:hypothetical protein
MLNSPYAMQQPMKTRRCGSVMLAVVALALLLPACGRRAAPGDAAPAAWRKVLGFDVLSQNDTHRADLGNNRMLMATWRDPVGWELGVFAYPLGDDPNNLLAGGRNWHGPQPWMLFAWTQHTSAYPDERFLEYDGGTNRLRILLLDCETEETGPDQQRFSRGRIEVYHKP